MADELTVRQAAKKAGVDPSYIRRLARQGRLEARQLDDWQWLIKESALVQWMESRRPRKG